jgi:hypothetical protein
MCYVLSASGRELLKASGRLAPEADCEPSNPPRAGARSDARDIGRLRSALHDVHVSGCVLAIAQSVRSMGLTLHGPLESVISPPTKGVEGARRPIGPADLRLSGGRVPHDFQRPEEAAGGTGEEVDRFDTIRPDAVVELGSLAARDLIIEMEDRLSSAEGAAKLARYDHFLAGWAEHTRRYGQRREATPIVVFVCRSRARARACAQAADSVMRACRAYAGEYPIDWQYPGREQTVFVSERDLHEGCLLGYGISPLPPEVRVSQAHGDPRARQPSIEVFSLLP